MTINLDPDFNPFPAQKPIAFQSFTFSGGEPHIKILDRLNGISEVTITHRIQSFNDFGLFLIAVDAMKRMDVQKINAFIPYFPAARQDRVMVKGEALTVKVYSDILNGLELNHMMIYDAHSEVAPALLHNCHNFDNHQFISKVVAELPNELKLISPDGGALKKIYKVAAHLKQYEVVECSKTRDVKTGQLSGFRVYAEDLQGMDCLIIDDICDGGGTFIGLAIALKERNAGRLYLAISHGIFSKGVDELNKHFDKIFTTDSFKTVADKSIIQIPISSVI